MVKIPEPWDNCQEELHKEVEQAQEREVCYNKQSWKDGAF